MDLDEVFPLFGTSSSSSSNSRRPTSVAGPKKRRSSILKSVVDPMSSDRAVLQDINGRLASDGSEVDKPKKRSRMSKRVSFSAMNQIKEFKAESHTLSELDRHVHSDGRSVQEWVDRERSVAFNQTTYEADMDLTMSAVTPSQGRAQKSAEDACPNKTIYGNNMMDLTLGTGALIQTQRVEAAEEQESFNKTIYQQDDMELTVAIDVDALFQSQKPGRNKEEPVCSKVSHNEGHRDKTPGNGGAKENIKEHATSNKKVCEDNIDVDALFQSQKILDEEEPSHDKTAHEEGRMQETLADEEYTHNKTSYEEGQMQITLDEDVYTHNKTAHEEDRKDKTPDVVATVEKGKIEQGNSNTTAYQDNIDIGALVQSQETVVLEEARRDDTTHDEGRKHKTSHVGVTVEEQGKEEGNSNKSVCRDDIDASVRRRKAVDVEVMGKKRTHGESFNDETPDVGTTMEKQGREQGSPGKVTRRDTIDTDVRVQSQKTVDAEEPIRKKRTHDESKAVGATVEEPEKGQGSSRKIVCHVNVNIDAIVQNKKTISSVEELAHDEVASDGTRQGESLRAGVNSRSRVSTSNFTAMFEEETEKEENESVTEEVSLEEEEDVPKTTAKSSQTSIFRYLERKRKTRKDKHRDDGQLLYFDGRRARYSFCSNTLWFTMSVAHPLPEEDIIYEDGKSDGELRLRHWSVDSVEVTRAKDVVDPADRLVLKLLNCALSPALVSSWCPTTRSLEETLRRVTNQVAEGRQLLAALDAADHSHPVFKVDDRLGKVATTFYSLKKVLAFKVTVDFSRGLTDVRHRLEIKRIAGDLDQRSVLDLARDCPDGWDFFGTFVSLIDKQVEL